MHNAINNNNNKLHFPFECKHTRDDWKLENWAPNTWIDASSDKFHARQPTRKSSILWRWETLFETTLAMTQFILIVFSHKRRFSAELIELRNWFFRNKCLHVGYPFQNKVATDIILLFGSFAASRAANECVIQLTWILFCLFSAQINSSLSKFIELLAVVDI